MQGGRKIVQLENYVKGKDLDSCGKDKRDQIFLAIKKSKKQKNKSRKRRWGLSSSSESVEIEW